MHHRAVWAREVAQESGICQKASPRSGSVTGDVKLIHLDCGYVWSAAIVHVQNHPLREVQLSGCPGLLIGPMEVHITAPIQPCSAKSVILHIKQNPITLLWIGRSLCPAQERALHATVKCPEGILPSRYTMVPGKIMISGCMMIIDALQQQGLACLLQEGQASKPQHLPGIC